CLSIVLGRSIVGLADDNPSENTHTDFAHEIVPILKAHCVECHGGEEAEGGFSLNTKALILDSEAVIPGSVEESTLIERIDSIDPEVQMPPADKPRLSDEAVERLKAWVDQGLTWEEGFTFAVRRYEPPLKPRRPELPPVTDGRTNPLDRIVDAYYEQNAIERPQRLADHAFLRRVHLDLVGTLPTPEVLNEFVDDKDSGKRQLVVRELLSDRQAYAEHWLTFWNDLLRNDYAGTGYIDGGRKQITSWLYQALLDNRPFDQFVRELIAPAPEAEGFIGGIKWRGRVNASQTQDIQFAQNISQVFLGINMKCASCHDSFIDRWTLEETYGLAAVYSDEPLELHRCDKPTGQMATAAWIFPELGQIDGELPRPERLQQLAALLTHEENGRFTRTIVNRLWHRLMGRGIVHPVDAMHTEPWSADLLDFLASHLVDNGYNLKVTLELIANSQAYQSQTVDAGEASDGDYVFHGPLSKRMTAEQYIDALWQITEAGPSTQEAGVERPDPSSFVRASLVKSDLLMRSLGRPNREQIVTSRPTALTTLQAIDLANGPLLAEVLTQGCNVLSEYETPDQMIDWLYRYSLSRGPTPDELAIARDILGASPSAASIEDLQWAVFMLPEFQLIR
ncbi:MAG: PSD1 and planctomycete cytochrome C domain-containing protein, partial [Pirellulales bacterium]